MEVRALTFHPSQMLGGSGGAQFHTQQVRRVHGVSQIQSVGREPGQKVGGGGGGQRRPGRGMWGPFPKARPETTAAETLPECSGDNAKTKADFRGS